MDKNCFQIGVGLQSEHFKTLAGILESVFSVRFNFAAATGHNQIGTIITATNGTLLTEKVNANVCQLVVPADASPHGAVQTEIRVRFSDDAAVPFPFRGRSLSCKVGNQPEPLKLTAGDKVLLTGEQGVLWSQSEVAGTTIFRSALTLPEIPHHGNLHDVLNGDRFLEMLPLLHFLRRLTGHHDWQRPPLRAQFMFDDPNLHWPTYGLVDYKELAARANRENYHVSFATVPLDAWLTNERAAALFREQPKRLSLCIHGNDHTKRELGQSYRPAQRVALLQQAIRRIEKLERRAGVPVSRVMVPPHGACAHEMLEDIPGCGFESACISHGSLRSHNRQRSWAASLGYQPVSAVAGCPVLPRWGFVGTTENTILLAAYLDQALVLRGHHQDLKDGVELLDEFARVTNSLGNVNWTNMAEISRQSFYSIFDKGTLRVRAWANRILLVKPEGLQEFIAEEAPGIDSASWRLVSAKGFQTDIQLGAKIPLPSIPEGLLVFERVPISPNHSPEKRPIPATAFARRLLTEGRDRLQGLFGSKQR